MECEWAKHFMQYVTLEKLSPINKPDAPGTPSREGGRPDYVFEDTSGREYAVEVKRLLTKELREVEQFALQSIAAPLEGHLKGTFTLGIPFDSLKDSRIPKETAKSLVSKIRAAGAGLSQQECSLSCGFTLRRVRDDGSKLVPWVTQNELPADLGLDHEAAKKIHKEFEGHVDRAHRKFRGYRPNRILLMNISQCGLDICFHASRFKGGQGIMCTWADALYKRALNIDHIWLDPGVPVLEAESRRRVVAGHKYVNTPSARPRELWRKAGIAPLLKGAMA